MSTSARRLDAQLQKKIGESWKDATPGLCIQAYHRGKKVIDLEVGKTYRYYDFASLTKIIFTTTMVMSLVDEKRLRLSDPVAKWLPWVPKKFSATVKNLLSHDAGMTWWYPFYEDVSRATSEKSSPEQAWMVFREILRERLEKDIAQNGVRISEKQAIYSDLDFFMLGFINQAVTDQSLLEMWADLRDRVGFADLNFHPGNRPLHARKLYAPTEQDDNYRKKLMQGEVHDENCWSLRGVAPHAGLFGEMSDLAKYGLSLRKAMRGQKSKSFPSAETVAKFTKRSVPRTRGDWALGFMMPTKGATSCGSLFSPQSVGHTGFTGTSLWYDPKRDLLVTILSNRVHPTRENKKFVALRPQLHTWIAEEF